MMRVVRHARYGCRISNWDSIVEGFPPLQVGPLRLAHNELTFAIMMRVIRHAGYGCKDLKLGIVKSFQSLQVHRGPRPLFRWKPCRWSNFFLPAICNPFLLLKVLMKDDTSIFIVGIDARNKIIIWNDFAANITGFPANQACGMDLFSCFGAMNRHNRHVDKRFFRIAIQMSLQGKVSCTYSEFLFFIHTVDDQKALITISLRPWSTDAGSSHGVLAVGCIASNGLLIEPLDIPRKTLRVAAQRDFRLEAILHQSSGEGVGTCVCEPVVELVGELHEIFVKQEKRRENSSLFLQTYEHNPDALIFGLDLNWNLDWWSDTSAQVFGLNQRDAFARNFVQVFIFTLIIRLLPFHKNYFLVDFASYIERRRRKHRI